MRGLGPLAVLIVLGCAEDPNQALLGTWRTEMLGARIYFTFERDGIVELLMIDQELNQEVQKGTWEIQGEGTDKKLCTHFADDETFNCSSLEITTMTTPSHSGEELPPQLLYQSMALSLVPGFDYQTELRRLILIRDSVQVAEQARADSTWLAHEAKVDSILNEGLPESGFADLRRNVEAIAARGDALDKLKAAADLSDMELQWTMIGLALSVEGIQTTKIDSVIALLQELGRKLN
ncbi:hypothetical protein LCGC14_1470960 [marine sediment metagenome]|uniref:Uncharacterized protein n=1 Tax=marine sediment metagenome TaxID=412755 RepID=A0A0F9ME64_9ZZZZ